MPQKYTNSNVFMQFSKKKNHLNTDKPVMTCQWEGIKTKLVAHS